MCADESSGTGTRGGRVDRVYPLPCYRAAIRALPADVLQYSDADRDIARALAFARRGRTDPGNGKAAPAKACGPIAPRRTRPPRRSRARCRRPTRGRTSRCRSRPRPASPAGGTPVRLASGAETTRRRRRPSVPDRRTRAARRDSAVDGGGGLARKPRASTLDRVGPVKSLRGHTLDFPAKCRNFRCCPTRVLACPVRSQDAPARARREERGTRHLGPGGQHGHRQAGDAGTADAG